MQGKTENVYKSPLFYFDLLQASVSIPKYENKPRMNTDDPNPCLSVFICGSLYWPSSQFQCSDLWQYFGIAVLGSGSAKNWKKEKKEYEILRITGIKNENERHIHAKYAQKPFFYFN